MAFVEQQQDWSDRYYFGCGKKGHQVSECKKLTQKEKEVVFTQKKKEWAEKNAAQYASAAAAPGKNHLSTGEKVAADVVNILVVDTGTTPGSVAGSIPSFQQYLEYQAY